nr:unknown [Ipomoea trifida]
MRRSVFSYHSLPPPMITVVAETSEMRPGALAYEDDNRSWAGSRLDIGILDMAPSLASVSSSFSNLESTEQDSGPTCKTLCILSPYALLK